MNNSNHSEMTKQNNFVNDIRAMTDTTGNNSFVAPTESIVSSEENQIKNAHNLAAEILNKLEQKKETAAAHLGISAAEVETMPFDLTALEQAGIFTKC